MSPETEQGSHSDFEDRLAFTVECKTHIKNGRRGRKHVQEGEGPGPEVVEPGRIPRISRLMALAIRFDELVRSGEVRHRADLARLCHVSRARVTQIMNLLNLAPDIQEEILSLRRTLKGSDPITERELRPILMVADWARQRVMWEEVKKESGESD